MTGLPYQRKSQRFAVDAPAMLEDFRTGFSYIGTVYNYSAEGVYLESGYAPRPGRKIYLKVDGDPDIFAAEIYHAEIRWRRPLSGRTSDYSYGIGIQYCLPVHLFDQIRTQTLAEGLPC